MAYLAKANPGRKLGLLRSAGTHLVLYFYAVLWVLWLKSVLIAVIHGHAIAKLKLNKRANAAVKDIKNPKFFCTLYAVACTTHPNLRLLCCCDKSTPVMNVLYRMTLRANAASEKVRDKLAKEQLFGMGNDGDLAMDEEEVFGVQATDAAAQTVEGQEGTADGALSNGSKAINADMDLHRRMMWEWEI